MSRRWLSRALIALAVPAVLVPTLATSATAAGAAKIPTVEATAKIYPHVATVSESSAKVYGPGKKCGQEKVVKGASQTTGSYSPDYTSPEYAEGDPSLFTMTGERPSLYATAIKFPNPKAAIAYLHGYEKYTKKCPVKNPGGGGGTGGGMPDCKSSMKKIAFKLGDERWGYQMKATCTVAGQPTSMVTNSLFVRDGKYVVYTGATSMDATAPSIPKSVEFTKLALTTVS